MEKFTQPIYVAKPFLPPFEEFCGALKEIWANQRLTNNGPVLQRYQDELRHYFETDNICLFANGTLALQLALHGMEITGEVITTPFTFVATAHALYWNNLCPVFCDIEPDTFTLDAEKVEKLITPRTSAILAVHVFGRPCNLKSLAEIAKRYNLHLIYDAAHAFGVKVNNRPIGHFGDLSMFSFHATKLYHSLEGGMLIFQNPALIRTLNYLKNFGFENETEVVIPGTNAKMNEMQALMGSIMLKYTVGLLKKRRLLSQLYRDRLATIPGIFLCPDPAPDIEYNYAYMPVQIEGDQFGMSRDELYTELKNYNIFTRRYFYPLINEYACYQDIPLVSPLPVAKKVASRILSLPMYADMKEEEVIQICDTIHHLHVCSKPRKSAFLGTEKLLGN